MDSDNENLLFTGMENSMAFKRVWDSHSDIPSFLSTHEYIPVRSTNVSVAEAEAGLNMYADIDGITIEWENIAATSHVFHHLFLIPRGQSSLRNVYRWLKKHEDLRKYSVEGRQVLRHCVGAQLLTDCGWEYVVALLPKFDNKISFEQSVIRRLTFTWIVEVKNQLRQKFIDAIPGGKLKQTLDKNNLNDLSQIFILPGDSLVVLQLFQECLNSVKTPNGFRKILFSYRFGEKNRERVYLPIRDFAASSKICVHVGLSIESSFDDESFFWSRSGLEKVIGSRGTLTTACSLYECANFQSNLDGSSLDISAGLRKVCLFPDKLQFFQLYADLPHRCPKTRYHPVSAAIIIGEGLRCHTDALVRDAHEYISELSNNFIKFNKSVSRLEFVMSLPVLTDSVAAVELISVDCLSQLLHNHALIVPFSTHHFIQCVGRIGVHLCETLQMLLDGFKGTGCSTSVWQAYQCELAAEKLLWGHPFTFISNQLSVNLGPGLAIPSRCVTDQFGFLRLENKFACCADEHSSPPLHIFSQSQCVQIQLGKIFGFWDKLQGSYVVLGRRLVELLLEDLHDVGSVFTQRGTFISGLKQGEHSFRVVSVISKDNLSKQLSAVQKSKFPMVYSCLLTILRRNGKDVKRAITEGLDELQICYFPAFRQRDQHRNECLYWHFSYGVWAIRDVCQVEGTTIETRTNLLCGLILNELENRKLCFTRSLNGTNKDFPWVKSCLRKLEELKLEEDCMTRLLTFVTCVAFLEGGRFVDYDRLRHLQDDLPLSQFKLRQLEIQGKFLVNNMNAFKLWRLHPSIPHQLPKAAIESRTEAIQQHMPDESEECAVVSDNALRIDERQHEDRNTERGMVVNARSHHLPTNQCGRWNSEELAILYSLRETVANGTTMMTVYTRYQAECHVLGIPDRSWQAFRAKFRRM